ncbi:MAG: HAD family hydrolase [Candidatus Diapherotrites archaeon]
MAKALGRLAGEAALFAGRRAGNRSGLRGALRRTGKIAVIDMDETLLTANTILEIFKLKFGEAEGTRIIKGYMNLVKKGHCSSDQALLMGYERIIREGVFVKDAEALVEKMEKEGKVRADIVEVAGALKAEGKTVVLASRMSETIAGLLAKRYGFDFGIGTRERIDKNGKVLKVEELVGEKTGFVGLKNAGKKGQARPYRTITKLEKVSKVLESAGIPTRPKDMVIVSDGYDDIKAFRQAGVSILLVPSSERRGFAQRVSMRLRLADAIVRPGPEMQAELRLRLGNPRTAGMTKRRFRKELFKSAGARKQQRRI